jgi:uncharacterized protein YicC (UPF0701 family)
MGLFNALEKMGLVEKEVKPSPQPTTITTAAPKFTVPLVTTTSGDVDPTLRQTLEHAVAQSTQPAYTNFRTLYDAMVGVTDDNLRYKLALQTVAASFKVTAADVVAALNDRIRLLDLEKSNFEAIYEQETKTKVGGTVEKINVIEQTIADYKAKIEKLQQDQATLAAQMSSAQQSLGKMRGSFDVAYNAVRASILAEIDKIKSHFTS